MVASTGETGSNFMTKKLGPMPTWAWMGFGLVVAYAYNRHAAKKADATKAPAGMTTGAGQAANNPYALSQTPDFIIQDYNQSAPITINNPAPGAPVPPVAGPPGPPGPAGPPAPPPKRTPFPWEFDDIDFLDLFGDDDDRKSHKTSSGGAVSTPAPPRPPVKASPIAYKVKPGDNLIKIAQAYGKTASQLFTFNTTPGVRSASDIATIKQRGPNLIYSGETILIPT